MSFAGALRVSRPDRAYGKYIKQQRHALPRNRAQPIGHQRQQAGHAEEERRVMPAVELRGLAEDRLLAGELPGGGERRGRLALEHIAAGGVDIGEVSPKGAAEAVVEAVRGGDQEAGAEHEGGEQRSEEHTSEL